MRHKCPERRDNCLLNTYRPPATNDRFGVPGMEAVGQLLGTGIVYAYVAVHVDSALCHGEP